MTRPRASREFPRVPSSRSDHHGALRAVLGSARPSARLGRRLVSLPASSSRILKIYVTPDGAPSPALPVASRAPQADNRHTIVLVQPTKSKASRTFLDYEKISLAMDGARPTARAPIPAASPRKIGHPLAGRSILVASPRPRALIPFPLSPRPSFPSFAGVCQMFEKRLKEIYPNMRDITYDITDLYNYIDALGDLTCLVFEPSTNTYAPYNKEWVKKRAFQHLKRQAGQR